MKSLIGTTVATILIFMLVLTGCITTPFSRSNQVSNTNPEEQTDPAIHTASSLMDSQEVQLRQSLNQTGVNVSRNGEAIRLNMPGHLTFASGSHKIKPGFHEVLNSLAGVLVEYRDTRINIYGHTDSVGKQSYNQKLSTIRARRVASYLAARGVGSNRFTVAGFGETQPIASNETKSGRSQNRRVEIEILPIR